MNKSLNIVQWNHCRWGLFIVLWQRRGFGNFFDFQSHSVLQFLFFLSIINPVIYVNPVFSIGNYICESIGNIYEVTAPIKSSLLQLFLGSPQTSPYEPKTFLIWGLHPQTPTQLLWTYSPCGICCDLNFWHFLLTHIIISCMNIAFLWVFIVLLCFPINVYQSITCFITFFLSTCEVKIIDEKCLYFHYKQILPCTTWLWKTETIPQFLPLTPWKGRASSLWQFNIR